MLKFRIALWLLAALILVVDKANGQSVWRVEEEADEGGCSASNTYEDGTELTIGANKAISFGWIAIWNGRWASIIKDRRYSIRIQFDAGPVLNVSGSGMRTQLSGGIFAPFDDIQPVGSAMDSQRVAIWNGENLIGTFSLQGSRVALRDVARCIGRLRARISADPFAN